MSLLERLLNQKMLLSSWSTRSCHAGSWMRNVNPVDWECQRCRKVKLYGVHMNGGFAEYVLVKAKI